MNLAVTAVSIVRDADACGVLRRDDARTEGPVLIDGCLPDDVIYASI